jgi:hypothetical protein
VVIEPAGAAALFAWSEPSGSAPLPPAFIRAGEQFHRAELELRAGHPTDAAAGFLAAAASVPLGADEFYADGFTASRASAYRNASIAFDQAKRPELARAAFTDLLARDPACANTLRELLARVTP